MATTLVDPKVLILKWTGKHTNICDFENRVMEETDRIKGVALSETMKVTWLPISDQGLWCIIEWVEWANENYKD